MVVSKSLSHFTSPPGNRSQIRRHSTKRMQELLKAMNTTMAISRVVNEYIRLDRFINAINTSWNVDALLEPRCLTLPVSMQSPPSPAPLPPRNIFGAYIPYRCSSIRASAGAFSKSEEDVHACFTRFGSRKSFVATVAVSTNKWTLLDVPLKRVRVAHAQPRIWFKKYNEPLWVIWRVVSAADCVFSSRQEVVSTHLHSSQLCVNKVNSERMQFRRISEVLNE